MSTALYVHVPFCLSKCAYCDFASVACSDRAQHARYLAALEGHLRYWQDRGAFAGGVPSVYVGGGTPTVLGDALPDLVRDIIGRLDVQPSAEVTVETNPDATDDRLVVALVEAGVTRFSLGVQSFDDATLAFLGRRHDAATAERAAAVLRSSGARFSVDLMCGVPGLGDEAWRATLARAVETGADHVSVYPLTVEDDTPLAAKVDAGSCPSPDADEAARQMLIADEALGAAGYVRYEVANYARPGCESRHNLGYWTGVPYVGVGPGAAGMLPRPGGGRARFVYPRDIDTWLVSGPDGFETETLSAEETAREDAMLRLRLTEGVPEALANAAGVVPVLEGLVGDGLLERTATGWRTTERGWLLGNEVYERVLFG